MKKIIVKAPNEIGVLFFGFSTKLKNFFRKYNIMRIDFFSMIQKRSIINRFCPKNGIYYLTFGYTDVIIYVYTKAR